MKRLNPLIAILMVFLATSLSSCQAIGDIFKAGIWVGIIIVVAVVGLIVWIAGKGSKK